MYYKNSRGKNWCIKSDHLLISIVHFQINPIEWRPKTEQNDKINNILVNL